MRAEPWLCAQNHGYGYRCSLDLDDHPARVSILFVCSNEYELYLSQLKEM